MEIFTLNLSRIFGKPVGHSPENRNCLAKIRMYGKSKNDLLKIFHV